MIRDHGLDSVYGRMGTGTGMGTGMGMREKRLPKLMMWSACKTKGGPKQGLITGIMPPSNFDNLH